MASSARIFFAGVGTTFLILGAGFGGGLLMANSALKEPTGYQAKAKAEPSAPLRESSSRLLPRQLNHPSNRKRLRRWNLPHSQFKLLRQPARQRRSILKKLKRKSAIAKNKSLNER